MTIKVEDVSDLVWQLVQDILKTNKGLSLTTHLGKAGTNIIAHHFPANWLNDKKVVVMSKMPTPDLNKLFDLVNSSKSYKDITEFQKDCELGLYEVLQFFSKGGFAGIAYDKTIFLQIDTLDNTVHELVHTLQWAKLGPKTFLEKYIHGAIKGGANYFANPAEKIAKDQENEFRKIINARLAKAGVIKTPTPLKVTNGYTVTYLKTLFKASSDDDVAKLLTDTSVKKLGIDQTKACFSM